MKTDKIKGYINIAHKANYLIIGQDNLSSYDKKLYLILTSKFSSERTKQLSKKIKTKYNCPSLELDFPLETISSINNCQILGIKNKGIALQIQNLITQE